MPPRRGRWQAMIVGIHKGANDHHLPHRIHHQHQRTPATRGAPTADSAAVHTGALHPTECTDGDDARAVPPWTPAGGPLRDCGG